MAHNVKRVYEGVVERKQRSHISGYPEPLIDASFSDVLNYPVYIGLNSIITKLSYLSELEDIVKHLSTGHFAIIWHCASKGRVFYLDELMGVKRKNPHSISYNKSWMANRKVDNLKYYDRAKFLEWVYGKIHDEEKEFVNKKLKRLYLKIALSEIKRMRLRASIKNIFKGLS